MGTPAQDHIEAMTKTVYHKQGACVVRHITPYKPNDLCSHRWQAKKVSIAERKKLYNKDLSKVDQKALPEKYVRKYTDKNNKTTTKTSEHDANAISANPDIWHVDKTGNFEYDCLTPYWHNSHHIVPNSQMRDSLENLLLMLLLTANYNLNHERNMVILPMQKEVSMIIKLPAHTVGGRPHHKDYSDYVGAELDNIQEKFAEEMNVEEEDHPPINNVNVDRYKKELEDLSLECFRKILNLGKIGAVSIDDIS